MSGQLSKSPKLPRYRAEKMGDFFIVAERCVRGFNYVYRNTGAGRFATREEAQAAISKKCSICGGRGNIEVERTNVATGRRAIDHLPCNCAFGDGAQK